MKTEAALDISSYLTDKALSVEKALDALIPKAQISAHDVLFSAARYSLLGGGKRLRPILALATAESLGASEISAMSTACALEMIHTYSLIHDDLPCMDNDDFRRGKPSLHRAYDEATAVLTGDYLLTYAFEVIADDLHLTSAQKVGLIRLLTHHAGGHGMIGGQVMDVGTEGISLSLEHINQIHAHKTGALIIASILAGAIIANAASEEIDALRLFGSDLGLAFQIIDDVIDVANSEQKHGRKIASDTTNNKTTYVTLMGIEAAQKTADDLYQSALGHLGKIRKNTHLLRQLAKLFVYRSV